MGVDNMIDTCIDVQNFAESTKRFVLANLNDFVVKVFHFFHFIC